VLRTLAAIVAAAGLACAAAPAAEQTHTIPPEVTVAGLLVGGLSAEPARTAIEAAFARPITVVYSNRQTTIDPAELRARIDVDAALGSALTATPRSVIALPVAYSRTRVAQVVAALARRVDRPARAPRVIGATPAGPEFTPAKPGLAVDVQAMQAALGQLLGDGTRVPLQLLTQPVPAQRTIATFGPVIVVTRATNTLRLYDGHKLVRTFPVATGQAIYPTPRGLWHIIVKWENPWWYPPVQDSWAKGLKPVPPGPSNPLGTRWMGLNAPGVGIHGTDEPGSIGYSASHGCIRMQVPDAEWLFNQVEVGTTVYIV
jgi:lipoprotein-anchoring transpeptidase ErfK/SrfK